MFKRVHAVTHLTNIWCMESEKRLKEEREQDVEEEEEEEARVFE